MGSTLSYSHNLRGSGTFLIFDEFVVYVLALFEAPIAFRLDRAEMHEDVLVHLRIDDETESLFVVEPLYCSSRHGVSVNNAKPNSTPQPCSPLRVGHSVKNRSETIS